MQPQIFIPDIHYTCRGRNSPPSEGDIDIQFGTMGNRNNGNTSNDEERKARDLSMNIADGQHELVTTKH